MATAIGKFLDLARKFTNDRAAAGGAPRWSDGDMLDVADRFFVKLLRNQPEWGLNRDGTSAKSTPDELPRDLSGVWPFDEFLVLPAAYWLAMHYFMGLSGDVRDEVRAERWRKLLNDELGITFVGSFSAPAGGG